MRVTAVTYNVHRCIGLDGSYSVQRVADVLNEIRPDIVGLQEVDTGLRVSGPLLPEKVPGVDRRRRGLSAAVEEPVAALLTQTVSTPVIGESPARNIHQLDQLSA